MTRGVLAFQPWDDGSHRAVRTAIERHGRLEWTFRSLPGRGPKWRLRHAALRFTEMMRAMPDSAWDGVVAIHATSMLDLAVLRATLPRGRRDLPMVLSMHENQVAYPAGDGASSQDRDRDVHLAFTNLASIEAADRVVWNSRWNRESFVEGMAAVLRHAPERIDRGWIERLEAKSVVVPPPIEMAEIWAAGSGGGAGIGAGGGSGGGPHQGEEARVLHNTANGGYPGLAGAQATPDRWPSGGLSPVRVVWPHRWEHDKGPDELLALADEAWAREQAGGPAIRWWLLGQRYGEVPEPLRVMLERHRDRIEHAGPLPREAYLAALHGCDWVLSTARHEFFGMAVAEALVAGCLPWLPRRLSYPELVPPEAFDWNPWTRPDARRVAVDPGVNATIHRLQAGVNGMMAAADAPRAVAGLEAAVAEAAGVTTG